MATIGNIVPITVVARLIGFRDINPMQLLEAAFDSTTMVGGTMSMDELNALVPAPGPSRRGSLTRSRHAWTGEMRESCWRCGGRWMSAPCRSARCTTILHTLLSAGGESMTSLLGNAVRMLAEDPALQQRLRDKPEILTCSLRKRCGSSRRFGK